MANQMNSALKSLQKIHNQLNNRGSLSPEMLKKNKIEKLRNEMINAKNRMHNSPNEYNRAEKAYFLESKGSDYYSTIQRDKYKKEANTQVNSWNKELLNSMFDSISNADIRFICGCKYDITDSSHKFLLVDYNDGTHDTEILNSIKIPTLNDPSLHSMSTDYNNNIIAINIKVNDSNNTRIFEMWDKLIQKIKMDTNKPILLVSGNNEIKEILGKKYNCIYNNTVSETDYSFVRGNNIVRGSAYDIFSDVITCTTTDFLPFTEIRIKYADILRDYTDINFVVEKVEKFDILVEYMTGNIKVN